MMTTTDQEVLAMVNALLDGRGVAAHERTRYLRANRDAVTALHSIAPLVDRYLAIVEPRRLCQIEHDHWEGKMICGNDLPCRTHGGR
jgi:hypothetical protein